MKFRAFLLSIFCLAPLAYADEGCTYFNGGVGTMPFIPYLPTSYANVGHRWLEDGSGLDLSGVVQATHQKAYAGARVMYVAQGEKKLYGAGLGMGGLAYSNSNWKRHPAGLTLEGTWERRLASQIDSRISLTQPLVGVNVDHGWQYLPSFAWSFNVRF